MNTDQNLLFAVLALQANLISAAQFTEACSAWVRRKQSHLADILVERGWLSPAGRSDVDTLTQHELQKHQGDVTACLAEATTDHVRQTLTAIDDPDINRTLIWTPAPGHVLLEAVEHAPGSRERYTLSRLHATGGIGRVWLARDPAFDRDVALKELRPERTGNPLDLGRFLREAKITGQLEHPGIVPVYEVGLSPDKRAPFYTMRFVRGRTLAEAAHTYHHERARGNAGPLEARELLTAFVGVCNAVAYAHSRGVIHRDLKPHNVVLGDFGEVIVLDWGLARLMDRPDEPVLESSPKLVAGEKTTQQGQVLGTPAYMAPEQAQGRLDLVDARTDVYGLGAVLYEILTGRPPFVGSDTASVLKEVISKPPESPRTVVPSTPAPLEAVCLKALAKNQAERYASAKALAAEIQSWLADEPVTAYREPWAARSRRWTRRHRTLVTSGVAVLVVAAVLLTAATLLLQTKNAELEHANRSERAANAALVESIDRERAAKERAEVNFTMARDAVDKYLNAVTGDTDLKKSDFNKLRKKLMETAVPFYEAFVEQKRDDPEQEAARGAAYQRLSALRIETGDQKAAKEASEKARTIFAKLVADHPDNARYRESLADAYRNFGISLAGEGAMLQAAEALTSAVKEYQTLAATNPAKPAYAEAQANSQNSVGVILHNLGRHAEAEAAYEKALAIRERLSAENADPLYQLGLARTLNSLGVLAKDRGNYSKSESYHRHALELREKLVAMQPESTLYQGELTMSYNNLGGVFSDTGNYPAAIDMFGKAAGIRKKLSEQFPTIVMHRQLLATTYYNLGLCFDSAGRIEEAIGPLRDAEALLQQLADNSPTVTAFRLDLGRVLSLLAAELLRTGQLAKADTALQTALAIFEKPPKDPPGEWFAEHSIAQRRYGDLLRARGDAAASLERYTKAIGLMEACLKQVPGLAHALTTQAATFAERAETLDGIGKHAEARADWDQAIKLGGAQYRPFKLLSEDQLSDAVAAATEIAKSSKEHDDTSYKMARVCALALAKAAAADRETYALRAIDLLRKARSQGYEPSIRVKTDPAFAALRSRKELLEILESTESKRAVDKK